MSYTQVLPRPLTVITACIFFLRSSSRCSLTAMGVAVGDIGVRRGTRLCVRWRTTCDTSAGLGKNLCPSRGLARGR